ncbi:MAG TPA: DEAD/DEAH box helicase family protein [Bacilli bacterium]|nr:DEAD/DEAH box helicase family protein [Bacilli bacterium]
MGLDMNRFRKKEQLPKEKNSIKIYDSLSRSGGLNDLWRGQFLALTEWEKLRESENLVVSLNTGAGKTIIGLLQGQALANETQGRVFYLCGSIQLVKQTAEIASKMMKLKVATYYEKKFDNELEFNKGNVICITTYQALLHGLSDRKLAKDQIAGLIFDDAHVAAHIIRDQYTLTIDREKFPVSYNYMIELLSDYFAEVHSYETFDQVVNQRNDPSTLFVPTFIWDQINKKIARVLVDEGVTEKTTVFEWEFIRDHLDLCGVFLSSNSIEITPFLPPVHLRKFMGPITKKIFLTATVQDEANFIRSFSFAPSNTIAPATRAGESERLIIPAYVNPEISRQLFDHVVDYSKRNKVLVISNSELRAKRWREHESIFSSQDFSDKVEEFKRSTNGLLVAPARFEGMDFPNDTCRTLVIDGLPNGTGLLEKFLWNVLGEVKVLDGTIAARVIQSLGRISRGNDDYGIVFLFGNSLAEWITMPSNRDLLPGFIRAQLELGERITGELTSLEELVRFEDMVLNRDPDWTDLHQDEVKGVISASEDDDNVTDREDPDYKFQLEVANAERSFTKNFWNRDYQKAARALEPTLDKLFQTDKGLAVWHAHWIGFCYLKLNDETVSKQYYNRAAKCYKAIGLIPNEKVLIEGSVLVPDNESQVGRIIQVLTERGPINYGTFSRMEQRLQPLFSYEKVSSNQYEEALRWLGCYLGFQSSRPDHDSGIGRGPDVFWLSSEVAIMTESKEQKGGINPYTKKEIGQSYHHLTWFEEEYPNSSRHVKLLIAGPDVEADKAASPSKDMHVWLPVEEICPLASKIKKLLYDAWQDSTLATLAPDIERKVVEACLTHMDIFNELPDRPIRKNNSI